MNIYFKEEQKFNQWWLWLILFVMAIIPILGIYKQFILGEPFGDNPMPDGILIALSIFVLAVIVFIIALKLSTEIDKYEIRLRYFPLFSKRFKWEDIKKAEVINYGFVGGWGIRLWTKYGTVYNVRGNKGLAIELLNGKRVVIGTQKEAELKEVIKKVNEQKRL